jgi:hypothetical protein
LAVNLRAAKLLHLSYLAPAGGDRTRHGAFLALGDWDAPALAGGGRHRPAEQHDAAGGRGDQQTPARAVEEVHRRRD